MNPKDDNFNFKLEVIAALLYMGLLWMAMIGLFAIVGLLAIKFPTPNGWVPSETSPVHHPLFPVASLLGGFIPFVTMLLALGTLHRFFYRKMEAGRGHR